MKEKQDAGKVITSLNLDADVLDALRTTAKREGVSVSEIANRILGRAGKWRRSRGEIRYRVNTEKMEIATADGRGPWVKYSVVDSQRSNIEPGDLLDVPDAMRLYRQGNGSPGSPPAGDDAVYIKVDRLGKKSGIFYGVPLTAAAVSQRNLKAYHREM